MRKCGFATVRRDSIACKRSEASFFVFVDFNLATGLATLTGLEFGQQWRQRRN
jgi:hypothetical protein